MGLPEINIEFRSRIDGAIKRGELGYVALLLKDGNGTGVKEYKITSISEIPSNLNAKSKEYIKMALDGAPREVKAVCIKAGAENYTEALSYLETIKFNVLAVPGIDAVDVSDVATWVKNVRTNLNKKILAVLPNIAADSEGVINVTTDDIKAGEEAFTVSEYTARVAGLIAGLPLTVAPTYQPFPEVTDVPKLTKAEADAKIDAGEFIVYWDGEKAKVGRGVTSLTTTTEDKGADWKKIKVVRILDMLFTDIRRTIEDNYIGKVQNSYINKLLLVSAINAYFEQLEQANVLDPGKNICEINVPAQRAYLKSIGEDVDNMTEQEIKEANTRDKVFLVSTVRPLDAIEDVELIVNH